MECPTSSTGSSHTCDQRLEVLVLVKIVAYVQLFGIVE